MSEMPSHFIAVCPNCLVTLRVKHSYSGNHVRCKHCEHKFRALAPDDLTSTPSSHYPLETSTPEDRITVICPACSEALSVRQTLAGQHVRCKSCDHKFLVEKIDELAVPAPSALKAPDLFDHLYSRSEQAETAPVSSPSDGELAAIRAERDRLQSDLDTFLEQHALLQSERDASAAELDQIRGGHEQWKAALATEQAQRGQISAELAAIQEAVGDLPPGAIEALRTENDSLRNELVQLRRQAELSSLEASGQSDMAETLAHGEQELEQARCQVEQLQQQVQRLDATISGTRASHAELDHRVRELEDELTRARSHHVELSGRLCQREEELSAKGNELTRLLGMANETEDRAREMHNGVAQRDQELGESRTQIERLAQEVHRLEDELAAVRAQYQEATGRLDERFLELSAKAAEISRLTTSQAETENHASELRGRLAHRDGELQEALARVEQFAQQVRDLENAVNGSQADSHQLHDRLGSLENELAQAHGRHEEAAGRLREHAEVLAAKGDEIARLLAAQAETEDQARQLQGGLTGRELEIGRLREQLASATATQEELQTRVDELLVRVEQEDAASRDALEAQRAQLAAEFESLAQQERDRQNGQVAESETRATESAQLIDRLRAETISLANSRSALEAEFETAREEIAELRRRLNEKETSQRSMSSLLEGMGIRLH